MLLLANQAGTYLDTIKELNEPISDLRREISQLSNATVDLRTGEALTVKRRAAIIDALNLQIGAYQAIQLQELEKREAEFKLQVKMQIGKDISDFQFNTFEQGPTPPGLASPGLPK